MVNIQRIRAGWTGFPGAPGVNTFYALDAAGMIARLRTFYATLQPYLPNDVTIQVENTGDIIDPLNGTLMGTWTGGAVSAVTGSAGVGYAAPTGAIFHWETGDVLDGHRLRGSTYIVPLASDCVDFTGSIEASALTLFRTECASLVVAVASNFVVWHRPRLAKPADGSRHAVTARAGGYSVVSASTVPDKFVVLTSRRD